MSESSKDEPLSPAFGLTESKRAIPAPPGKPSIEAYDAWLEALGRLNFPVSVLHDQSLVDEFTSGVLAVTKTWASDYRRTLDNLHEVANTYQLMRSRLLKLAPDVDLLESEDLLMDFGELRLIFSGRGDLAVHLDDISRLSIFWNEYSRGRQQARHELEPRFAQLQSLLSAFTTKHKLPPAMLTISDDSQRSDNLGAYHQGKLELNLYLLASSVTAADLVETIYHELVHAEQDALVLRCIADRVNLQSAQATEEDLDRFESVYREALQLTDWPSFRPFIQGVLALRQGVELTVQEQWRAAYLIAAWHQGRCVIEQECEIFERLNNAVRIQKRLGSLEQLPHVLKLIDESRRVKEALCDSEELTEPLKTLIEAARANCWLPSGVKSLVSARDGLLKIVNERVECLQALMDGNWGEYRLTHDENEAWVIGTRARLTADQMLAAQESTDEDNDLAG